MDTTGLEQMICFELYAASRAMTALYRPHLEPANLTYPQFIALRVLGSQEPMTVRDLGKALHLDSGTLSPLLKRLETQGHLRRERGTADERTVWIHLTDTGRALHTQLASLPEQIGCAAGLTMNDYTYLQDLLGRIRATSPVS